MQKQILLRLKPSEAAHEEIMRELIAETTGRKKSSVTGFRVVKKSIDARSRQVYINLTVNAFIDEPFIERKISRFFFPDVTKARGKVIIVGAGPAGLFAAIKLIENGIKPVL